MFNAEILKERLIGLVGWRCMKGVDSDNDLSQSESGMYFDGEHPMLNIKNLQAVSPADQEPQDWLKEITEDGIIKAVSRLLTEKLIAKSAMGILDSKILFDQAGERTTYDIDGIMTGVELHVYNRFGVMARVERIGLCYDSACEAVIKLWHTSQKDPVKTKTVNYTRALSSQWFAIDPAFDLNYDAHTDQVGGHWIITVTVPDGVRSVGVNLHPVYYGRYLKAVPFTTGKNTSIWDKSLNNYEDSIAGINVHLALQTDFTYFILDQRHTLAPLISKQVAALVLRHIAFNPSAKIGHHTANISKAELLYELDGDSSSNKKSGIGYELDQMIKAMALDMEKLDNVVFTKKNKSVRYKTI